MRRPLVLSILLHLIIVVVALVGLFKPRLPSLPQEVAPVVDVLSVAELTRAPAPAQPATPAAPAAAKAEREARPDDAVVESKPPPEPVKREPPPKPAVPATVEPIKEAPPPPEPPRQAPPRPKPEPVKAEPAKPEPVKQLPPQKQEAPMPVKPAAVPKPTPTPVPAKTVAKPAPPPEPAKVKEPPAAKPATVQKPAAPAAERKAEPQPPRPEPPRAAEKKPEPKQPEPKADFDAVQKAIHELGRQATAEKRTQPQAQASAAGQTDAKPQTRKADEAAPASALDQHFARVIGKAPASAANGREVSQAVSMSEIDAVRRQIERCWSLPPGLKGGDDLKVSIRVEMNANGTPRAARVEASPQMNASASYRATAESALRAVLNPRCHPFNLPAEKFDRWQTMTLVFDPKEMLGT